MNLLSLRKTENPQWNWYLWLEMHLHSYQSQDGVQHPTVARAHTGHLQSSFAGDGMTVGGCYNVISYKMTTDVTFESSS